MERGPSFGFMIDKGRRRAAFFCVSLPKVTEQKPKGYSPDQAMASISMSTPCGRSATPTVVRAGASVEKNAA